MRRLRQLLAVTGLVLGIVVSVLTVQPLTERLNSFPLQTSVAAMLAPTGVTKDKQQIFADLDARLKREKATAYRVVSNDNMSTDNIAVLGVDDGGDSTSQVWGLHARSGHRVPLSQLVQTPLAGTITYASTCGACAAVIGAWAGANGLAIEADRTQYSIADYVSTVLMTNRGLTLICAFLLVAAVLLSWVAMNYRNRLLRVIHGVRPALVNLEDLLRSWGVLAVCLIFGWAASSVSLGLVVFRPRWLPDYLMISGLIAACLLVVTLLVAALAFGLARVSAQHFVCRRQANVGLVRLGLLARVVAIVVAAIVIPISVNAGLSALDANRRLQSYDMLRSDVTVGVTAAAADETANTRLENGATTFVRALERGKGLRLMAEIQVDGEEQVRVPGRPSRVMLIDSDSVEQLIGMGLKQSAVPSEATKQLFAQMEPWLNKGVSASDFGFVQAEGVNVPVMGTSVGDQSVAENATPLLIIPKIGVADAFNGDMLSSFVVQGGLMATSLQAAQSAAVDSGFADYVVSFDGVYASIKDARRAALTEAIAGVVAILLALASICLTLVQSASIWAARRSKLIFVRHLAGARLANIVFPGWLIDIGLGLLALAVASGLAFWDGTLGLGIVFGSVGFVALVYAALAAVAYRGMAARVFANTLQRRG